jgi:hypothetical protein
MLMIREGRYYTTRNDHSLDENARRSKIVDVLATFLLLPEGQVLLQQLNDGLGIAEVFLGNVVNLLKGRL